jgi:hypothetical protein
MSIKRNILGKIGVVTLSATMLTGGILPSIGHAQQINNNKGLSDLVGIERVNTNIQGTLKLGDNNVGISDVMTFEELAQQLAKDNSITTDEAVKNLTKSITKNGQTISPYATYRTLSGSFTVTSTYKPQVKFYCETNEGGGSFRAIVKILNVGMDRGYNGISKQFNGSVYTNLEDPNRIFWIVNGDFYNNGSTTGSVGVNIGVGKFATVNFGVSSADNHYKYFYGSGYTYF